MSSIPPIHQRLDAIITALDAHLTSIDSKPAYERNTISLSTGLNSAPIVIQISNLGDLKQYKEPDAFHVVALKISDIIDELEKTDSLGGGHVITIDMQEGSVTLATKKIVNMPSDPDLIKKEVEKLSAHCKEIETGIVGLTRDFTKTRQKVLQLQTMMKQKVKVFQKQLQTTFIRESREQKKAHEAREAEIKELNQKLARVQERIVSETRKLESERKEVDVLQILDAIGAIFNRNKSNTFEERTGHVDPNAAASGTIRETVNDTF